MGTGWRSQQLESHLLERLGEPAEPSVLETRHVLRWRATIYRIVRRANAIGPAPTKPPRLSHIRFQAELPNFPSAAIPEVLLHG